MKNNSDVRPPELQDGALKSNTKKLGDTLKAYLKSSDAPLQPLQKESDPLLEALHRKMSDSKRHPVEAALAGELFAAIGVYEAVYLKYGTDTNKVNDAAEQVRQLASWLGQANGPIQGVKGAPFKQRRLAVKALEKRLTKKDSWTKLRKICNCDKSEHDFHCGEAIRKQVGVLKKFLKARNIEVAGV